MCQSAAQSAATTYGPIKNNTSQLLEQVRYANTADQQQTAILNFMSQSAEQTDSLLFYTIKPDAN